MLKRLKDPLEYSSQLSEPRQVAQLSEELYFCYQDQGCIFDTKYYVIQESEHRDIKIRYVE